MPPRPRGPIDEEVAGLGQVVGPRARRGRRRPAASRASRPAAARAAFIRTRVRTAIWPWSAPTATTVAASAWAHEGAHVRIGDAQPLVEERPQAGRQRGVVAGQRGVEMAPPEVEELVGEGQIPERARPSASGWRQSRAGARTVVPRGARSPGSAARRCRRRPRAGSCRAPRPRRGRARRSRRSRRWPSRPRPARGCGSREDAGAGPIEEQLGAVRGEGEEAEEDRQLLAGQGRRTEAKLSGSPGGRGLRRPPDRILIDGEKEGVESAHRVLGIVVEQAVDRRAPDGQLHLARRPGRRSSRAIPRALGAEGRRPGRPRRPASALVAGREGQAPPEDSRRSACPPRRERRGSPGWRRAR